MITPFGNVLFLTKTDDKKGALIRLLIKKKMA